MTYEKTIGRHFAEHRDVAGELDALLPPAAKAAIAIRDAFAAGGHLYTLGNGGSAADAQHFAGELVGHYRLDRRPLPAITLGTDTAVATCIANDYRYEDVFARQLTALVRSGDVVVAFTTSGRSPNVVAALEVAKTRGAITVLFGGRDGGHARPWADHALLVPSTLTPRVQEVHTLLLHAISDVLDVWAGEPT